MGTVRNRVRVRKRQTIEILNLKNHFNFEMVMLTFEIEFDQNFGSLKIIFDFISKSLKTNLYIKPGKIKIYTSN